MSYTFDKELELRSVSTAAASTTHTTTALDLDVLMIREFRAVINVTSVDRTTGDETYVFAAKVDSSTGFGSPTTVATLPSITAPGTYEIPLAGDLIKAWEANAAAIALTCTIGGTTPLIRYGAWLAPAA
jgi:hypothetical protein